MEAKTQESLAKENISHSGIKQTLNLNPNSLEAPDFKEK